MIKKVHSSIGYVSFLFLPILSLILAIKNYRMPWAKNIVWAFIAFYAYHFTAPNEGADIFAYLDKFHRYVDKVYSIPVFIKSLYTEGSTTLDVIEPLISYLISQITWNHHFLLLAYGIIFGFFYSRNVWFFIEKTKGKLTLKALSILVLFVIQIGIWDINGFRFWCAAQIFIYATLNLIIYKRSKGYLFLAIACLMHLGLLLPVLILLLFKFIKFPISTLLIFFLFTFFLAELDLVLVQQTINNYAPDFVVGKLNSYTSEAYVDVVNERLDNYSVLYKLSKTIRIAIVLFFISTLFFNKKLFHKDKMYKLFTFYLILGGVGNILSQLPSGSRYVVISDYFLYGVMFYFIQNYSNFKFEKYINIIIPFILLYVFYNVRIIGIHTFNIHHLFNNPFFSLFIY